MAKSNKRIDQELFDRLRSSGLRKSVARQLATAGQAANKRAPDTLRRTVSDLTDVLNDLEGRVTGKGTKRQQAARKAATTRKRTASKRSAAARKGAATRARTPGSRSTARSTAKRTAGAARSTAKRTTGAARSTAKRSTRTARTTAKRSTRAGGGTGSRSRSRAR
jgi:cell division septum initiation protein DivIVA